MDSHYKPKTNETEKQSYIKTLSKLLQSPLNMNQSTPVNLESEVTRRRRIGDIVKLRTLAEKKRKEAEEKQKQAVKLNRQAEREDDKAEAADNYAQTIQNYRQDDLTAIAANQKIIDRCNELINMGNLQRTELKERTLNQIITIRSREEKEIELTQKKRNLEKRAHIAGIKGLETREIFGNNKGGKKHKTLLKIVKQNHEQAKNLEGTINSLQKLIAMGTENLHIFAQKIKKTEDEGIEANRAKCEYEKKVGKLAQLLATAKREKANCDTIARKIREWEEQLENRADKLEEEAEIATKLAKYAEEEANRLIKYASGY